MHGQYPQARPASLQEVPLKPSPGPFLKMCALPHILQTRLEAPYLPQP